MNTETKIIAQPGVQELFIIREFDAPRASVFNAFADPKIMAQFYAPFDMTLIFNSQDYRSGGHYNWSCLKDGKPVCTFAGVIHEITAPLRIIQTGEYLDLPERGNVALEKLSFEELPGNRTKLIMHQVCPSVAVRDAIINNGMDKGVKDMFVKLDRLLRIR